MKVEDLAHTFNKIMDMQFAALKSQTKDSGWVDVTIPYYSARGVKDFNRIIYADHDFTETYIESCFTSLPGGWCNSKSHRIQAEPENGLFVLTLFATQDSSD